MRMTPRPFAVVIFGASGDLTRRKLFPALHNLHMQGLIPPRTAVVGTSRTQYSQEDFATQMRKAVEEHSRLAPTDVSWDAFADDLYYVPGDVYSDDLYAQLGATLETVDRECGTFGNRLWYLATLPELFPVIPEQLAKTGLRDSGGHQRLVVEKPFGGDLESARELNQILGRCFEERQTFRIDHYLGKETVQNLLVFRFANAIFEPLWNRRYVDHVQITVAEDIGIGSRAAFYERVGALRDVAQNHLLQLLALITMEPPVAWDADAIRSEKEKVLRAVRRWSANDFSTVASRGQYAGYREEEGVDPHSSTETFVAIKLLIDNWRWAGVPFYLRTGKKLPTQATEIAIQFHRVPHLLFKETAVEELAPNELVIRIQPDEGCLLTFGTKVPGPEVEVRTVDMEFDYETDFGSGSPEAYERLLLDCMLGDATLFARCDEIEEAWEIFDPVLQHWSQGGRPATYQPGTWGPESADELVRREGRRWRDPSA
ncbi:MAG TPA: glucose-6-phosphate dehydrogenase [Actinomycetota bacterium]|nr:glucose-6-phosphate dehydrogenase [Actinomycetota bacterium]